ncbi:hypothetical protein ACUYFE_03085 [Olegusella massiliensis]|uniref:hypothetical protein n=1 Tax=Olegusella massiliensis TaxID=1776381 RepID=UPI0040556F76
MLANEVPFRSLLARPVIVRYDASRLFDHYETLFWPKGADSVICYTYYDRQAGLNLDILAPARFEDGAIFHKMAPMPVAKVRMIIRPEVYESCEVKFLSERDEEQVLKRYSEQRKISDSYWRDNKGLVTMLSLEEIDHLRHPQYPLDVQVGLIDEDGGIERVWMRLEGVTEEGYLTAELLNNPYGSFECAVGDLMALLVTKDSEGALRLYTRDAMVVDVQGRRMREEYLRKRTQDENL